VCCIAQIRMEWFEICDVVGYNGGPPPLFLVLAYASYRKMDLTL